LPSVGNLWRPGFRRRQRASVAAPFLR
jgi:hypothetical protein